MWEIQHSAETTLPIKLSRKTKPSFAVTINEAQGQSTNNLGV